MKDLMKKLITAFGVVLLGIVVNSCDQIGLGDAVDTKEPSINITYPKIGAVIRDTFLLAGTCDDDIGVTEILVTVQEGSETVYETKAELSEDKKSWQVYLNNYDKDNPGYTNGWQFRDGNYFISVKAIDKTGHESGAISRNYVIDNTGPILVLEKPSSVIPVDSKFGRVVNIKGATKDRNAISSMKAEFRETDENGNIIEDSEKKIIDVAGPIQMSESNAVVIAEYINKAEDQLTDKEIELSTNYLKLYKDEAGLKNGSYQKYFYKCDIKLYDEAKVSKDVKDVDGTGEGNASTEYFINDTNYNDEFGASGKTKENFSVDKIL